MKTLTTALLTLITVATAIPAPHCRPSQTTYTAKYDDLTFDEGNANPIPADYNGLSYTTFQVDQYDGFIPPTSGNQWTMAFGGSGNISIPDGPWKNFQIFGLESFSFACVSGIPQPECEISIWGWKRSGKVIKRTITYPRLDPGHVIEDFKMNKTTFSGEWRGLKSVGFSIARKDNGGDMFGGLALDDVKYQIISGCEL